MGLLLLHMVWWACPVLCFWVCLKLVILASLLRGTVSYLAGDLVSVDIDACRFDLALRSRVWTVVLS